MMKMQKLSKYVKTHKLISLGVAASTVALVATGIGTFSYFSDSKTANTNLTLNKGTVILDDKTQDKWVYLGNTTVLSSTTLKDTKDITVKNFTGPKDNYSGRVINPDLTSVNLSSSDLNSRNTLISDNSLLTGTTFFKVVPGDVFRKTYEIDYTGSNSADILLKVDLDSSWNTNNKGTAFNDYYDYVVDYSIEEKNASNEITEKVSPTTIFGNISNIRWDNTLSSNGFKFDNYVLKPNQIIKLYVTVKIKNTSDYSVTGATNIQKNIASFSSIGDKFIFTAKNHLEQKTVTTQSSN